MIFLKILSFMGILGFLMIIKDLYEVTRILCKLTIKDGTLVEYKEHNVVYIGYLYKLGGFFQIKDEENNPVRDILRISSVKPVKTKKGRKIYDPENRQLVYIYEVK